MLVKSSLKFITQLGEFQGDEVTNNFTKKQLEQMEQDQPKVFVAEYIQLQMGNEIVCIPSSVIKQSIIILKIEYLPNEGENNVT